VSPLPKARYSVSRYLGAAIGVDLEVELEGVDLGAATCVAWPSYAARFRRQVNAA
jgi:hypothetical protein